MKNNISFKTPSLKNGLPFGAVMATAGVAVLGEMAALQYFAALLTVLAVIQALWITVVGLLGNYGQRGFYSRFLKIESVNRHTGVHTIPLGLAVVTNSIIYWHNLGWTVPAAKVFLLLTWLTTFIFIGRFLTSLVKHHFKLKAVDGAWFLVPAALLGAAIATNALVPYVESSLSFLLNLLILISTATGWLGYGVIGILALIRLYRYKLKYAPQAPWWIFMGCAGLAAASVGTVTGNPMIVSLSLRSTYQLAMYITGIWGIILFVPTVILSVIIILNRRQIAGKKMPWPPTFSTVVFALGCLQMGTHSHNLFLYYTGHLAIYITFGLWIFTFIWNGFHLSQIVFRKYKIGS